MSNPKDLYDVARDVTHAMGMSWYDPRTGERHDPPADAETRVEHFMRDVLKRQGAIHAHAQTLVCPECKGDQNQIMNLSEQRAPFRWRCRLCGFGFVSGRE